MSKGESLSITIILALQLLATQSCSKTDSGRDRDLHNSRQLTLSQMTDDQKLQLYEQVPLGVTLAEVKAVAPTLGRQRLEGIPGQGLTGADAVVDLLGLRTRVEFNFHRDTLYSVWFGPLDLPADSGDELFARLSEFYSHRLGTPRTEDGQDSPYPVRSRSWPTPRGEIGLSNSLAGDRRLLGWGYQPASDTRRSQ